MFPGSLRSLLMALLLALLCFLRRALGLWPFVLTLGLGYLLLMLGRRLWWLLPLMLRCRDILLRRRLGNGGLLSFSAALLRRWYA